MDPEPLPSWFPSILEIEAYTRRRREERGWEMPTALAPSPPSPPPITVEPKHIILEL